MTKLVWDDPEDRIFEAGVDRGVLYFANNLVAIPWNGLMAVDETSRTIDDAYFFDGVKRTHISDPSDFTGRIQAFTCPDELLDYDGGAYTAPGALVDNQNTKEFSMSFRTLIGSGANGMEQGYKIHILYNLTAVQAEPSYETLSDSVDPLTLVWDVSARPERITSFRPTAHVIIDSTRIEADLLSGLEEILYGREDNDASLPPLSELLEYVTTFGGGVVVIVDNEDGTWSATGLAPYVTTPTLTTFQLTDVDGTYLNDRVYELTVTEE